MGFQQMDDRAGRLVRRAATFQGETDEIHAEQGFATAPDVAGEDGFIADHHAGIIGAHLRPPHPVGAAENRCFAVRHLGDFQIGAAYRFGGITGNGRMMFDPLGLGGLPVGVLGEVDRFAGAQGERVTHQRSSRARATSSAARSAASSAPSK